MTFWIISSGLALLVALLIGRALLVPRASGPGAEPRDMQVYRDQLRGVEKDLARGVVSAEEAERLRTEIKRRLLDADKARGPGTGAAPQTLSFAVAAATGLALIGGSVLLYERIGAPGYPDQPLKKRIADAEAARDSRPSQEEFEAMMPANAARDVDPEYADLVEKLRAAVAENPEELEGWMLLARNEARLGNFPEAHAAQREAIELKGEEATSQDYSALATLMIQAAGGNVSKESDAALNAALTRDPHNPLARYYAGLMHLQTGRPDLTFAFWEPLLRDSAPDAPWVRIIRSQLEAVAALAGIQYTLPAFARPSNPNALPGLSAEDMQAAADMTPEERQEMIRSMVDQLGERLATEGGPPQDWARMISSLGVIGETERAAAIWEEAQQRFQDPAQLAIIGDAARAIGLEAAAAAPGPTAEDMQAAAEMTPEERQEMIRSMVDQLGERLATEGGPPQDWARLISSLGVLGETERAAAIWEEAQQRFQDPDQLAIIRAAAVAAGLDG